MLSPAPHVKWFAAAGGYRYAVRHWPASAKRGHVVLLHGIISHSGWYLRTGSHLAAAGFHVHALDRRGSGLNLRARGDNDSYLTWLQDVEAYLEHLGGELPRVLLGVSWGGVLATAVARHASDQVDGLGLLCPGLFSRKGTGAWQKRLVRLVRRVGAGSMRVSIPLRDPGLFTETSVHQAYIRDDPFTLRKVTLRCAEASADLYSAVIDRPDAWRQPTLLMLAGRDPVIANDLVRQFVERWTDARASIVEYPEAGHTLEFEPDPTSYLERLEGWCSEVCAGQSQA
ncbi:MAG: alpha/beta fold hydrolase [Planctomycetota bacterium]